MTEISAPAIQTPDVPQPTSLPRGVTVRPAAPGDVAALVSLLRGDELAASGESSMTETEVAATFESSRARERLIGRVLERDGALIGLWRVGRNFDAKYSFAIAIDRRLPAPLVDELWQQGLQWSEAVALSVAAARGIDRPRADLWVFENDDLARRHAEAAGFEQVRAFIEMQLDLPGYAAPTGASAVTLRRAEVTDAGSPDLRAMYEVITESFRDHFDFTERTFDDWAESRLQDPLRALDHWYFAELDGMVVGGLVGHNAYLQSDDAGYVANLGVLRSGRGRGAAKALLRASFARYAADGRAAVKLHVDAESPTGATHLYESVGMYRRMVGYDFHKSLGPTD
ncbi:MAG: GNAT family N-acetyltransferase [Micropruina sp.]|nr:GNAT family N-acetyltransferase [Micropruina sp.]